LTDRRIGATVKARAKGEQSFVARRLWRRKREEDRADEQEGDPHALDREGDPRGGVQSDEYRHVEPTEVVADEEVVMSCPGGAPQEDLSPEERRDRDRS